MRRWLHPAPILLALLAPGTALALDLPAKTDPAFAEAWNGCLNAIAGGGTLDEALGWTTHDTGDVEATGWENWTGGFATKDVEGVGSYNLSVVVENYPGYDVGLCDVRVDNPERDIDGPPLKTSGFPGSLEGDGGAWSGAWRSEDATMFVRSLYSSDTATFRLSMTKITPVGQ